ncbi:MAG: HAMP domain-containing histidine kinase [Kangiellaceae bacterium]|nr:HAMP domain-containing histidine kinase [Kangiellaceae bacterium]MCW9000936.1 HAMP domain-containing histidine kinase [Kangiellaceae bacterium]
MSFRKLSLIFITFLLSCVLLLQWWSITRFTENVAKQIGESAFEVSRNTAETLIFDQPKLEFRTLAFQVTGQTTNHPFEQILSNVKQDVTIELVNEQIDDFIMLNADGSEYQIPIPRTGIHHALESFSNNVLYSTIVLLLFGVILAFIFTHKMAQPLKRLKQASKQVGEGKLGVQIENDRQWHSQEIESTLDSFNQMSKKLADLSAQNQKLQNKAHLAELAEIAKGLAHTIRNPLNTLNLAIDQYQSCDSTEDKQNLSRIAKQQVARIDKWIRSLMDVMTDDVNLIRSHNINDIVKAAVDDSQLSNDRGIEILFTPLENAASLKAVEPELKGVLQSIISNAVEASDDDAQVIVAIKTNQNTIDVSVEDSGKGFSGAILNNMFTPHNTDKTYGAGMGLYLAHRIIKNKYNGNLNVSNNSDKGSTVILSLNDRSA